MTSQIQNIDEIVMSNLEDYETLYKVDLNFDADVSKLKPEVMTDYIVRVLANHPYYINVNNIVDVLVNEGSNTVTVVVSTRDVQEKIVNMTNDSITLNSINEKNNVISEESQEKLNLVSAKMNKKKFVLETTDNKGEPRLYEYEFAGFGKAKNLFVEKSVKMGGNKYRHFLRNNNDNPYFYDEYMNSEIVYSPDNKINMLERKIDQIERNVYGNDFAPNNVDSVKTMLEHSVNNAVNIPKPTHNVINNKLGRLNMSMSVNSSNNLLPVNNMTMQIGLHGANGLNLNHANLATHQVNHATHQVNNATHQVNNGTHRVNNATHQVNNETHRVNNATHQVNNSEEESNNNNVNQQGEENSYELNDVLAQELNDAINEPNNSELGISKYIIVFLVTILLIILFILIFELINNRKSLFKRSNVSQV